MDHDNAASHVRAHTAAAIRERLQVGPRHSYLRDFIYGSIDGAVTTFAVVSGVAGANLSSTIVIILGMANLLGDGFSMATGNYLATRADRERIDRVRKMEHEHIDTYPEGEREEIRQIFAQKGFTGADLERIVSMITADRERWVDTMIREEYGLTLEERSPLKAAGMTFLAFILLGALPLAPFIYEYLSQGSTMHSYRISTLVTVGSFFVVGAVKSRFVDRKWYTSGLTTLLAGSAAAGLAYLVGLVLRGLAV
jgi:vacuolar iron transporter family protein